MATIFANNFETGLADQTVMTTGSGGNTGGTAGDYFGGVFAATGTVDKFVADSFVGSLAGQIACTASTGGSFSRTTTAGTVRYRRGMFKITAFHSGTLFLTTAGDSAVSAAGFSVRLSSAGILSVYRRTVTAATLGSLSVAIALNTWYRIEEGYTAAGDWELRVFPGNGYAPLGVISGTGATSGLTNFDSDLWGCLPSTGTYTGNATWDNVKVSDSGWVGPIPSTSSRPISVVSASGWSASGGAPSWQVVSDANDATFATSPTLTGTPAPAVWGLAPTANGTMKLTAKLSATTGTGVDATVTLKQGATTIATRSVTDVPVTATLYEWTLTTSEQALLVDTSGFLESLSLTVSGTT